MVCGSLCFLPLSVREQGQDCDRDGVRQQGRAVRLHQRAPTPERTRDQTLLQADRIRHPLLSQGEKRAVHHCARPLKCPDPLKSLMSKQAYFVFFFSPSGGQNLLMMMLTRPLCRQCSLLFLATAAALQPPRLVSPYCPSPH